MPAEEVEEDDGAGPNSLLVWLKCLAGFFSREKHCWFIG
jgi:hypothetical protein